MPSDSETIKHMARGIAQSEGCHADDWRHFTEQAQAALDAQRAIGLVSVPVEPTEAMIKAGEEWQMNSFDVDGIFYAMRIAAQGEVK
jgi:hypothetical protein